MSNQRIQNDLEMRVAASPELILALDLLLQKSGDCLTKDQRFEVLSVIIAAGCVLRNGRRYSGVG